MLRSHFKLQNHQQNKSTKIWENVGPNWPWIGDLFMEKAMAPHSSTLAWKIPGTGEPGRLPSMGSHRVRHGWSNLAAAVAAGDLFIVGLSYHTINNSPFHGLFGPIFSDHHLIQPQLDYVCYTTLLLCACPQMTTKAPQVSVLRLQI